MPCGVLNGLHPIGAAFHKLAGKIEEISASEQQTIASTERERCAQAVKKYVDEILAERDRYRTALEKYARRYYDSELWPLANAALSTGEKEAHP